MLFLNFDVPPSHYNSFTLAFSAHMKSIWCLFLTPQSCWETYFVAKSITSPSSCFQHLQACLEHVFLSNDSPRVAPKCPSHPTWVMIVFSSSPVLVGGTYDVILLLFPEKKQSSIAKYQLFLLTPDNVHSAW